MNYKLKDTELDSLNQNIRTCLMYFATQCDILSSNFRLKALERLKTIKYAKTAEISKDDKLNNLTQIAENLDLCKVGMLKAVDEIRNHEKERSKFGYALFLKDKEISELKEKLRIQIRLNDNFRQLNGHLMDEM